MRILVFGATGATGQHIVTQALAEGWSVTAFSRRPENLITTHASLRAIRGDVRDARAVSECVPGHDAVISALGVGTPLKPDPGVVLGVQTIVNAMKAAGVPRLVYLSFIGVRDSRAAAGPMIRFVGRFPLRHEIADHETKERSVSTSDLAWTIVRPPKLTTGAPIAQYRVGESIRAKSFFPILPRANVAQFIVKELRDNAYVGKVVRLLP